MQLVCLMPTIHFRPAESRKKSAKGGKLPPPHPLSSPQMHPLPPSRLRSLTCLFISPRHVFLSLLLLSQPCRQHRSGLLCHRHRSPIWSHDI